MRKTAQKYSPERQSVNPISRSKFKDPFEPLIELPKKEITESSTPDLNLMSFSQIFKQGRKLALPIEPSKRSNSVLNQSLSNYTKQLNLRNDYHSNFRPA
jgi:hypothetical protein